jgi:hypothetical protein
MFIATALYSGMRIEDLQSLDLAYAPPFGTFGIQYNRSRSGKQEIKNKLK